MKLYDIVVTGHFAVDHIKVDNKKTKIRLGGAVTYASLAAANLGSKVSVISKVGSRFPLKYTRLLTEKGVNLRNVKSTKGPTTELLLAYKNGKRTIYLLKKCEDITAHDVPEDIKGKIIHIAPIVGELDRNTTLSFIKCGDIASLDPQGFLRHFNHFGCMRLKSWFDREILGKIHVFKCSREELKMITGTTRVEGLTKIRKCGVKVAIMTLGRQGVILTTHKRTFFVPAYNSKRIVDTTGAGDTFIGSFLSMHLKRPEEYAWCAAVGVASASVVVEEYGPSAFNKREQDLMKRAEAIYENVKVL